MNENNVSEKDNSPTRKMIEKRVNKFLNDYFKWFIFFEVAVILIFGYFLLLKPKYDQISLVTDAISKQEQLDYSKKDLELKDLNSLIASYKTIDQRSKDRIYAIAPVKKNEEELFSEMNYIVTKNGLILRDISWAKGSKLNNEGNDSGTDYLASGDLEQVTVNLNVVGANYESFKNFLSALENNLHLMDVENVSFDPGSGGITLVISTYYSKE